LGFLDKPAHIKTEEEEEGNDEAHALTASNGQG
jgi:hypothetical protein